jgi:hypothetical protein
VSETSENRFAVVLQPIAAAATVTGGHHSIKTL